MKLAERIQLLGAVGDALTSDMDSGRLDGILDRAEIENPWFVKRYTNTALQHVTENYLSVKHLSSWLEREGLDELDESRTVGLIPAGNIPLVGLHDLISVFVSGHKALIKPSSKDKVLMNLIISTMCDLEPSVVASIEVVDRLKGFDAVIATGSNNTHRYFEYYFGKYPNVLRRNRVSVAVLSGNESSDELTQLGDDVFTYFGLGCRNVSKIFVPKGFDMPKLLDSWKHFEWMEHHNKYQNNYMYRKSVQLVNNVSHYDTGYSLVTENRSLFSPIGVVHYEEYESKTDIIQALDLAMVDIQVVVSNFMDRSVPLGSSQYPAIDDYADGANTISFLKTLK